VTTVEPASRTGDGAIDKATAQRLVSEHPLWYHTMEVAPGVVTPGWFDLRPIVDRLPWPEVRGKRCLDVGPYDGFLSFELERRGAAEVLAVDIGAHEDWDWPVRLRGRSGSLSEIAGPEVGAGFHLARRLLGSNVERRVLSAYDLSPDEVGEFDVVVCGALMLHLRDPLRALEAIRSVCRGHFLSAEEIAIGLTVRNRKQPLARLNGIDDLCQWWVPNAAGHRRMVEAAGFQIVRQTRPYAVRFGPAHPPTGRSVMALRTAILTRLSAGARGVPYAAVLGTPDA
jgi:2-polyprenyl-3-methyl-5-hydroxy-6-metoxy-1,4-benzoquinol methylase